MIRLQKMLHPIRKQARELKFGVNFLMGGEIWQFLHMHGVKVVKLTKTIPEHLRGVVMTMHYTNPRLPLPLPHL